MNLVLLLSLLLGDSPMPTVAIPARTIPAGEIVLGPMAVTRWRRAEIALDAANLVNPLLISIELSTDGGQSWRVIAAADFTGGSWLDRNGTPHTDIGLRFALRVDAQRDDQIRMRLANTSPWQTAGGTLTVESDPEITLGPEHRSIALVSGQTGSAAADGSGTTLAVTVPGNVTAGNLIVSAVGSSTGAAAASSVADGLSNSYSEASGSPYNSTTLSEYLGIWLAPNIAGGAAGNITANWGSATTFRRHAVAEFSGTATSSVQEGSMATGQGTSTSASTSNLSPTADGSMLIGWCNDASVPTIGSGFTSLATYGSDSLFEYRVQGTATAEPVTAGISPSAGWGIVGVIIKPAAGGGGGPTAPLIHCYETASSTSGSMTLTKPTSGSPAGPDGAKNASAGDYVVIAVGNDSTGGAGTEFDQTNAPSGFTFINAAGNGTSDAHCAFYYRKLDGTEGSSWTVDGGLVTSGDCWAVAILLSGVHPTVGTAIHQVGADTIDGTPPIAITQVTTTLDECLVLAVYAYDGGDDGGFSTGGTGWAELTEARSGTGSGNASGGVSWKKMSGAGATVACTVSVGLNDGMAGFQLALAPAPPAVPVLYDPTMRNPLYNTLLRM